MARAWGERRLHCVELRASNRNLPMAVTVLPALVGQKKLSSHGALGLPRRCCRLFPVNPIFQMKTRLQAQAGLLGSDGVLLTGSRAGYPPAHRNWFHGVSETFSSEGIRGLYKGAVPLLFRGALLTAGQQIGYDGTKTVIKANGGADGPLLHGLASIVSAAFATGFSVRQTLS